MLVKLPRICSGHEIVEAFKNAASFNEMGRERWQPKKFGVEFQYEPGSVKQTIRNMGIRVIRQVLENKYIFFGPKVWKNPCSETFTLKPIALTGSYDEVEVLFYHHFFSYDDPPRIVTDINTPGFEEFRLQLEKILQIFFTTLHPQNV